MPGLVALAMLGTPAGLAAQGTKTGCTFEELPPAEQRRFQSRYHRRVRTEGQAAAGQWLHQQVCLTAEERRAQRQSATGPDGRPCARTRLELRNFPSFGGGAMTMGMVPVCVP